MGERKREKEREREDWIGNLDLGEKSALLDTKQRERESFAL